MCIRGTKFWATAEVCRARDAEEWLGLKDSFVHGVPLELGFAGGVGFPVCALGFRACWRSSSLLNFASLCRRGL